MFLEHSQQSQPADSSLCYLLLTRNSPSWCDDKTSANGETERMRPFLNLHSQRRVGPFPQSLLLLFSKHSQVTELSLSDLSPLWTMQSFLFSLCLLLIQTTLLDTGHSRYSPIYCQSKYEHQSTII